MNHSVYPITRVSEFVFTFTSNNADGTNPVRKGVAYVPFTRFGKEYYNLEFGDFSKKSGEIDDLIVTDNGDMRRVLRTVVSTLEIFLDEFYDKSVHIDGSSPVRRAYYHKLIRDYQNFITPHFNLQGYTEGRLETFRVDIEYDFIVVNNRYS